MLLSSVRAWWGKKNYIGEQTKKRHRLCSWSRIFIVNFRLMPCLQIPSMQCRSTFFLSFHFSFFKYCPQRVLDCTCCPAFFLHILVDTRSPTLPPGFAFTEFNTAGKTKKRPNECPRTRSFRMKARRANPALWTSPLHSNC